MWSKRLKVTHHIEASRSSHQVNLRIVIARNALVQEESEEFSGDFSDPIDIHLDKERDGCAC